MDIGAYTFEEFTRLAENFHGYAAPGLLIGGYMVELGKRSLPEGTLFEAVVETAKCLPDAVQLLTLCSTGNQRLKVLDLGLYAVSLFHKNTCVGVRVSLDSKELEKWPEICGWFFKRKAKKDQDVPQLLREIEAAGDTICKVEHVVVDTRYRGHGHMHSIEICPVCGEAFPGEDGAICRNCQGEAPFRRIGGEVKSREAPEAKIHVVPVEEAVGKIAAHDMTRIVPGQFKGPEFRAGQRISAGDVCRLQTMGRFHVAVTDETAPASAPHPSGSSTVHENAVAELFARRMAGQGVTYALPPKEGKIDFKAELDGLLCVDVERMLRFNLVPEVMVASRHDATMVKKGEGLAGTRAIPLFLSSDLLSRALDALEGGPLFRVLPLRRARVGILVTGTEVFNGLIQDRFEPIVRKKVEDLGCEVTRCEIVPDDKERMKNAVLAMREAGCDLLITTGGMSVDPDDVTRLAMIEMGLTDIIHGIPVLPGTMSLVGSIPESGGHAAMQVIGVPACALYHRTTFLDLVLPRLLAGRRFTRAEAARLGEGGYCTGCKPCTWPRCWYGK